jgi:hypothetical protein
MRILVTTERDKEEFIRQVRETELGDKPFVASFELFRKKRSLAANSLYWKWLRCLAAESETGSTIEDFHAYFGEKCLPYTSTWVSGEESTRQLSSSELDTKQFSEYMDAVKFISLHSFNTVLPEPGDELWDRFILQYGGE